MTPPRPTGVLACRAATGKPPLTRRETEVLTLAAEGLTDLQIAHRLGITRKTVSTHMANLRGRVRARNRTHAVALAAAYGLITLEVADEPAAAATGLIDPQEDDAKLGALWEELLAAGPVGARPGLLAERIGRSRGYVYRRLRGWADIGWVEPLRPGYWRACPERRRHPAAASAAEAVWVKGA